MNRSVPVHPVVPPLGAFLAAAAALLATAGLGVRLFEVRGALGALLSADAPGSLTRFLVAGVLAAVAVAAAVGRRPGWTAVALPAAVLTVVEVAETVQPAGTPQVVVRTAVGLALAVAAVVARLRGRGSRVLALLGVHAVAAGLLPAVPEYARGTGGPVAEAFATFVEQSALALTAVAVLVAVLVEVLPRLGATSVR